MGVFMFLFGCQLVGIFLKGMLGIPFGNESRSANIDVSVSLLSIIVVIIVIVISVKAKPSIRRYALLLGIIIGWIFYTLIFGLQETVEKKSSFTLDLFPFGEPVWDFGVIITAVLAGLLNTANMFGALKGTDAMFNSQTTHKQYRSSFTIMGICTCLARMFGLVPYASYVSSIGDFFSKLPISIGSAVLFVAYLQLLNSSWKFFHEIEFSELTISRAAIPLFVGIVIMTMPVSYFETHPSFLRLLLSSGLLMGTVLAFLLENLFQWE